MESSQTIVAVLFVPVLLLILLPLTILVMYLLHRFLRHIFFATPVHILEEDTTTLSPQPQQQ